MITLMVRLYYWWPLRPHCDHGHHSAICRATGRQQAQAGIICGEKPSNLPTWRDWQK
jgi:hypothetical protein